MSKPFKSFVVLLQQGVLFPKSPFLLLPTSPPSRFLKLLLLFSFTCLLEKLLTALHEGNAPITNWNQTQHKCQLWRINNCAKITRKKYLIKAYLLNYHYPEFKCVLHTCHWGGSVTSLGPVAYNPVFPIIIIDNLPGLPFRSVSFFVRSLNCSKTEI